VVVGGGVGGLLAAIRLRAAGHEVVVLERLNQMGGKLATYEREGFTFDIGPSLLTLPALIDEVFQLVGTSLDAQVQLQRLNPQFRYFWQSHRAVTVYDNEVDTASAFDSINPGSGAQYLQFLKHARRIWQISQRTFLSGPMTGPLSLLKRMESPRDFRQIDAMRNLHAAATKHFTSPLLQQWLGRYATYSGSSPFEAPATLSCIAAVEADGGAWYTNGGLGALRDAVVRVAEQCGVQIRTNAEVLGIESNRKRVTGVRLLGGEVLTASLVVANVDAEHLYADLLPQPKSLKIVRRAGRSTSGVMVLVGAKGTTPNIVHHNVWFSADYQTEFAQMAQGKMPDDPTIYACVSAVTDASQAPPNCENWFLLVNAPAGAQVDTETYGPWLVNRLALIGVDLRDRVQFIETIGPNDIAQRYRSSGGAIYGTSSNGKRAAFRRPANRGPRKGLYLVGGSSHPGGGLPMVAMSARIVANLISRDMRDNPKSR
jgi:phytoene desaturase